MYLMVWEGVLAKPVLIHLKCILSAKDVCRRSSLKHSTGYIIFTLLSQIVPRFACFLCKKIKKEHTQTRISKRPK